MASKKFGLFVGPSQEPRGSKYLLRMAFGGLKKMGPKYLQGTWTLGGVPFKYTSPKRLCSCFAHGLRWAGSIAHEISALRAFRDPGRFPNVNTKKTLVSTMDSFRGGVSDFVHPPYVHCFLLIRLVVPSSQK